MTKTCECGCGQPTPVASATNRPKGYIKGEQIRFIKGHNNRLRVLEANPRWRGDEAGRSAIHKWLNKHHPLSGTCEECGATEVRTEWSNNDHTWRRVREDYRELCGRCHRYYDYEELGTPNPLLDQVFA